MASPGALLPLPLQVRVQSASTGRGAVGVKVRWEIAEGVGAGVDPPTSLTDSTGLAVTRLTLGPGLGGYRVVARILAAQLPPVEIRADAILVPELTLVPGGPLLAGDTVRLEGRSFSPNPEQNVVTFSGIRGHVLLSSPTQLQVEVPPCLPPRGVDLKVQVGFLSTTTASLQVEGGTTTLELAPGEDLILDPNQWPVCVHLPSEPGSSYLLVPHSTGAVGGAAYGTSVVGLTTDGVSPALGPGPSDAPPVRVGGEAALPGLGSGLDAQQRWELRVRLLEREILDGPGARSRPPRDLLPTSPSKGTPHVPQLGETRKFKVLNRKREFDNVTAVLRFVAPHTLVYVDERAPEGGFSDTDLASLAGEFENTIHPVVTGSFGKESDLDGNDGVVILLTPTVNELTETGADGYVGGFFFGLDLMPGMNGSNGGEVFYALVPDPSGRFGPALSRSLLLAIVPAVLAHEFAHMVHYNQRMLVGRAEHQDALWLSEAMAQMAEDLVGEAFEQRGATQKALQYRQGNWSRARRFLEEPSQVSVLASLPPGTLAERGAGWLLLKQLSGHDGLLAALARSTRTGVDGLTYVVGKEWGDLIPDWAGSLYLDGLGVPVRSGLRVPGVNLREALSRDGAFPLDPPVAGGASFSRGGSLWSSAADYLIINPPASGGIALSVSGPGGRPPDPGMGLQFLVVRLR